VLNLPDGRVELVAEGEKQELDAFLAGVEDAMSGNITEMKKDIGSATGEFGEPNDARSFDVRY